MRTKQPTPTARPTDGQPAPTAAAYATPALVALAESLRQWKRERDIYGLNTPKEQS
jgi:hypothetical protein